MPKQPESGPTWPAAWYPSPNRPGQNEFWDGTRWTGLMQNQPPRMQTGRAGLSTWVVGGAVLLSMIPFVASGGVGGLLIGAGLAAMITAIYILATGRGSWLRLPRGRKFGAVLLAGAFVVTMVGGSLVPARPSSETSSLTFSSDSKPETSVQPSTTPAPTSTPATRKPTVTTKTVTETQAIDFTTTTVDDSSLASGTTTVVTAGVPGKRTITYKVTYTDGAETGRVVVTDTTIPPVTQVIANGTYVAPAAPVPFTGGGGGGCDPNYSGQCVPIDSDVDCAGGSGNGPSYTYGPVYVVGSDIYDLDRDGDGVGCD